MPPSRPADVHFDAPAVERGVGLFETLLVVDGRPLLLAAHLERLLGSLAQVALPAPGRAELEAAVARALAEGNPGGEAALRLSWIAVGKDLDDPASFRLDASLRPVPPTTRARRDGCRAVSLPPELCRDTPGLKSTSYLGAVLGLRHAMRRGGDEGLFRGPDGCYSEGTATAIVAWDEGRLLLPRHPALPSVTAAAFAGAAPRGDLTRERLLAGAILLGSLTLAAPLLTLDGDPCRVPPAMAERLRAFNEQLLKANRP